MTESAEEKMENISASFVAGSCVKFAPTKSKIRNRYLLFLVACTRHYTSLCRSVRPSVRPKSLRFASLFSTFSGKRRSDLSYCPCPTTILLLPTRTRLMLPCIRPCSMKVGIAFLICSNLSLRFSWRES